MHVQPAPPPPSPLAQAVSAVPDWLQILAALGTTLAGLVGPVAAFAAIRAANASRRQAKQSTEAASRALEALGRALRPERLRVSAWLGPQPIGDMVELTSPTLLRVSVANRPGPAAAAVSVYVTPADGGERRLLSPARQQIAPDEAASYELQDLPLGTIDRGVDLTLPRGDRQATAEHVITIEFTDVRELLRWRQVFRVAEILTVGNRQEGHTVYTDELIPLRMLAGADVEEPEIIEPA